MFYRIQYGQLPRHSIVLLRSLTVRKNGFLVNSGLPSFDNRAALKLVLNELCDPPPPWGEAEAGQPWSKASLLNPFSAPTH